MAEICSTKATNYPDKEAVTDSEEGGVDIEFFCGQNCGFQKFCTFLLLQIK